MCRIFFPIVLNLCIFEIYIYIFLTLFLCVFWAKFRPPLLLNNTFIIILKSVVRRRTTEQNSLRREARNALEEH